MERPNPNKFKSGDEVIAVHDIEIKDEDKIHQGDRHVVTMPFTPCCGGLVIEGYPHHFPQCDFELYKTKEERDKDKDKAEGGDGKFTKENVMMGVNRITHLAMFASQNALLHIEALRDEILVFMDRLGLTEEFREKFK